MIITELQYASLVISLSTLGQTDLAENDRAELRTLAHLLSEAAQNVARALAPTAALDMEPFPVGARVVVTVADDVFTGQHGRVAGIKRRPRLQRKDYTLDIDDRPMKYGAGPYQANEIAPEEPSE